MNEKIKKTLILLCMASGLILCLAALVYKKITAGAASTIITILALLFMIVWARRSLSSVKLLSLMATLAAAAALGRIPFAALPGVQPTSFLVMVSGLVFGPQAGFMIGAMAALASNFFLGQGPWTPWQMLGWGLMGMSAAGLTHIRSRWFPLILALWAGLWGYLFGWIQNIGFVTVFVTPVTIKAYLASCVVSFAFDSIHAAANFLLCLFFAGPVVKILERFSIRLGGSYLPVLPEPDARDIGFSSAKQDKAGS